MIIGYETKEVAYAPLMELLDGLLMTPPELAAHHRYSVSHLANMRRANKGPPWLAFPNGGIRYRVRDVLEWELSGTRGPMSLERVTLAVSACTAISLTDRAAVIAHLEQAFSVARK